MALAVKYLLIGGGVATACAAESIRKVDGEGSILMVGAEPHPPYSRPPTSKQLLLDDAITAERIYLKRPSWYERQRIEVRSGCRATQLATEEKTVSLDDGTDVVYQRLLVATGTTLNRLGIPGDNLSNVFYLRTVDDALRLREAAVSGQRAVVIGSGFIGLEVASALTQRGLSVTVVSTSRHIWNRVLDEGIADWLEGHFETHGVGFKRQRKASSFLPRGVQLDDGQFLECDLVVVGIGVRPDMTLFMDTPLHGSNGVSTNQYLETSVSGVYAAGDIAHYDDVIFHKKRRVEHFDVAMQQGRKAGANMAGEREPFDALPFFFSDMYDMAFEFMGEFEEGWDRVEINGDMETKKFGAIYYLDGVPLATMHVNQGGRPFRELETELRGAAASRV